MTAPSADRPAPRDLPYRVSWRSPAVQAGAHRGRLAGAGGLFRDMVSLLEHPDPRRIDLRASARDPFEQLYVRRFEQKTPITVFALVDVSASMGFAGNMRKLDTAAAICAALASSARRTGDKFGLMGCGETVARELHFPPVRSRAGERRMMEALRSFQPRGHSAHGLIQAAGLLAGRRKLIVLISDFHMPDDDLTAVFEALRGHDIVPVHLADSAEAADLPSWGILPLTDLETGERRLVALRPSLKAAWRKSREKREQHLRSIAARSGREPFRIVDRVDWDQFAAYLLAGGAR